MHRTTAPADRHHHHWPQPARPASGSSLASGMNPPNPGQQGLPPPYPVQHPRPPGFPTQQRSDSPHQPNPLQSTSQGPYISPHSSSQSLAPQHPSPYIGSIHHLSQHHPGEPGFFGAHPSPYSTNSAAGSYASSGLGITSEPEPGESMAAQAAMSRPQYPPISSYQTPQSNSPASMHSPPTDQHGRPLYGMQSIQQQPMYYTPPYSMQQPSYGQHPPGSHHPSMTSAPGMLMSHNQPQQSMQQPPQQQHSGSQQLPSSMIDSKPSQGGLPRPPSVLTQPHGTPQTPQGPQMGSLPPASNSSNPTAAPGPIPATTPLVVRQDGNGVQWIAFEYSRDRVKMEYTIRCDVESVNIDELGQEFKSANCVYPRACCNKDQYKGNRLHYESECNAVGWALAQLNPNLREKRGLIQRAVDSWRNSNQDVRLRSRRVRRQAKVNSRKSHSVGPSSAGQLPGPSGPPSAGLQNPQAGDTDYDNAPSHHHQPPPPNNPADIASPSSSTGPPPRYGQSFYPAYPQQPAVGSTATMPSVHDSIDPMHPQASTLASPAGAPLKDGNEGRKRALFGDVPESKRRKFILVEDGQRGTRVRVRVTLDQINMDEIPDQQRRVNAVYPRSYFPRQVAEPAASPRARMGWDDDKDEGEAGTLPTKGKTMVPVKLLDDTETELPLPRMTASRRSKEIALNELAYRMSWGQARTFHGRTLFLQRSLDAYRNKMRSTMVAGGQDPTTAPHFETRPGKRKWQERMSKRGRRAGSASLL